MRPNLGILVIFFNRPECLRQNLQSLCDAGVQSVFLARDGHQLNTSKENLKKIEACDMIALEFSNKIQIIDWLKYETNVGVDTFVPAAISWALNKIENLIILEDDCLIDKNFIEFASRCLEIYENDMSVAGIYAPAFLEIDRGNFSGDLIRSKYPLCWGWATSRDRWIGFEEFVTRARTNRLAETLSFNEFSALERLYWKVFWRKLISKEAENWDAFWHFFNITKKRDHILCLKNLSTNIGWGVDATHTKTKDLRMGLPILSNKDLRWSEATTNECVRFDKRLFFQNYWPGWTYVFKRLKDKIIANINH